MSINHCFNDYSNMTVLKTQWYCIFYNVTFMVSLFIILSDFFLVYSILKNRLNVCDVGESIEKIGWSIVKRYVRLTLPIIFVFLIVSALQKLNLYH